MAERRERTLERDIKVLQEANFNLEERIKELETKLAEKE